MSTKTWDKFDFGAVAFKEPTKNTLGGMNVYCDTSVEQKSNPTFQLPRMRVPFGPDRNEQSQSTRLNLELSVEDPAFFSTIQAWDGRVLEQAAQQSKTWFGKSYSIEKIKDQEMYRYSIQGDMQGKYPPLFRLKLATEGKKVPKIYILERDENGKETWKNGSIKDVEKGSFVTPIAEISGLWFVSKKGFGCGYVASHILVEKTQQEESFPFIGMGAISESSSSAPMDVDAYASDLIE